MLLRDAQEEVRILYAARRDSAKVEEDLILSHLNEAMSFLNILKDTERKTWDKISTPQKRVIGMLLMITLGLANEMKIDSLQALQSVLLEESP